LCFLCVGENTTRIVYFVELGAGKMTVGKIYAGLLIVENWRAYRDSIVGNNRPSPQPTTHLQVSV